MTPCLASNLKRNRTNWPLFNRDPRPSSIFRKFNCKLFSVSLIDPMVFGEECLNEAVMEAMIFLDPPYLAKSISELSISNILKALNVSLTAASIEINCGLNKNDDDDLEEEKDVEVVGTLADLYRTIILSSSLLLEMCPWKVRQPEITSVKSSIPFSLSEENLRRLNQNIIQSILLLQRLSHFSYSTNALPYSDWHDELLPKSRHPLLQECFEKKPMVDLEENIVFGMEDRLVSLNLADYSAEDVSFHFGKEALSLGANDNVTSQCPTGTQSEGEGFDLSVSLYQKQLEREESELLDIAFKDDSQHTHGHSATLKKRTLVSVSRPANELLQRMKKDFLMQHILIPFYGVSCVIKEGNIVWNEKQQYSPGNSDISIHCRLVLFANGVIVIRPNDESSSHNGNNGFIEAFCLTPISKCVTRPIRNKFYFTIENLIECTSSFCARTLGKASGKGAVSMLLGVDENRGGGLAEGYNWITVLEECTKQVSRFSEVEKMIKQQWLS